MKRSLCAKRKTSAVPKRFFFPAPFDLLIFVFDCFVSMKTKKLHCRGIWCYRRWGCSDAAVGLMFLLLFFTYVCCLMLKNIFEYSSWVSQIFSCALSTFRFCFIVFLSEMFFLEMFHDFWCSSLGVSLFLYKVNTDSNHISITALPDIFQNVYKSQKSNDYVFINDLLKGCFLLPKSFQDNVMNMQ